MEESSDLVIQRMNELSNRIKSLQEANSDFRQEIEDSKVPVETGKRFTERLEDELRYLSSSIEEILELLRGSGQAKARPEPQPIKTEDLAQHFRSVVDTIQLQSRQSQQGEVATIIKNLDVEIKGLIVVQENETRIVTPTLSQSIDPAQLSTIRMSFNTIPVLRTQSKQPPPVGTKPKEDEAQEQKEEKKEQQEQQEEKKEQAQEQQEQREQKKEQSRRPGKRRKQEPTE